MVCTPFIIAIGLDDKNKENGFPKVLPACRHYFDDITGVSLMNCSFSSASSIKPAASLRLMVSLGLGSFFMLAITVLFFLESMRPARRTAVQSNEVGLIIASCLS